MEATPFSAAQKLFPAFQQLRVDYDAASRAVWSFFDPQPRPCMTSQLLKDLKAGQANLRDVARDPAISDRAPIEYLVLCSSHPRFFSLGGDLALFHRLIKEHDDKSLTAYAHDCVDVLYGNATNLGLPLMTIAVVHGDALGGGFEAVLSCNVIIAESGVRMGFPEILVNLLPGMGGYTLLRRRVGHKMTEQMLMSGLFYTAEELHELGVVDLVVPRGEGQQAARDYMYKNQRQRIASRLLLKFRSRGEPISYSEMIDITAMWVEAAMSLSETELHNMERLIAHQDSISLNHARQAEIITLSTADRFQEQPETA